MPHSFRGKPGLFIGLLLIFAAYLAFLLPDAPYLTYEGDSSVYLVSAKSLASGRGYRLINSPDAPPAKLYPIGFPALIAPVMAAVPNLDSAMLFLRVLAALECVAFLYFSWRFLLRYLDARTACVVAVIFGLLPSLFLWATLIMAEWPFGILTLVTIALVQGRIVPSPQGTGTKRAFLAGIVSAAALLLRTIGFTVFPGVAAHYALRRQWRNLFAYGAGFFLMAAPWLLWSTNQQGGTFSEYGSQVLGHYSWRIPAQNLVNLSVTTPVSFTMPLLGTRAAVSLMEHAGLSFLPYLWGGAVSLATLCGMARLWKRSGDVIAPVLFFYTSLLVIWPWDPGRFLLPVLPLLAAAFVEGVRFLSEWRLPNARMRAAFSRNARRLAVPVLAVILASAVLLDMMWLRNLYVYGHQGGPQAAQQWRSTAGGLEFLRRNAPPDAVVLSSCPQGLYLLTGRKSENLGPADAMKTQISRFQRDAPVYVLARERHSVSLADEGAEYSRTPVINFIRRYPDVLAPVWKSADGTVMVYKAREASSSVFGAAAGPRRSFDAPGMVH